MMTLDFFNGIPSSFQFQHNQKCHLNTLCNASLIMFILCKTIHTSFNVLCKACFGWLITTNTHSPPIPLPYVHMHTHTSTTVTVICPSQSWRSCLRQRLSQSVTPTILALMTPPRLLPSRGSGDLERAGGRV